MQSAKTIRFYSRAARRAPAEFPGMLWRRLREAASRPPFGQAQTKFGPVVYDVDLSLHRLVSKYYFHTHEMFLEPVFRSYLKPGDTFLDIGANCGYWSAFSANLVGIGGAVHAFEPVPDYFEFVRRLSANNPTHAITANNMACGKARATLKMVMVVPDAGNYANLDTNIGSNSLLPGFLDHEKRLTREIDVAVVPLDAYIADKNIDLNRVGLIKIDVEGFESYVLDGMQGVLEKSGRKVPILCEVLTDPKRHELMDGAAIVRRLESCGYRCVDAVSREPVDPKAFGFEENILCL